jgi:cell division topological specificity factor
MFENITNFLKKLFKMEEKEAGSKETAKERLHLVLMQDRANVSTDFLELMKQEIIDVIKKYIDVDEKEIDVRLTNKTNSDGTNGAPALYANIPIVNIKSELNKTKIEKPDAVGAPKPEDTSKSNNVGAER